MVVVNWNFLKHGRSNRIGANIAVLAELARGAAAVKGLLN
jgi:hypothetical protein